ncbi:MAG TPA: hypothetical protein VH593_29225 [Ktedonobacteraceae bacterium]|jgi:hypothetical protein
MNLADAFSQVTCTVGEAQAILTSLLSNIRDSYPDLHASMTEEIAGLHEHDEEVVEPPADESSSSL